MSVHASGLASRLTCKSSLGAAVRQRSHAVLLISTNLDTARQVREIASGLSDPGPDAESAARIFSERLRG